MIVGKHIKEKWLLCHAKIRCGGSYGHIYGGGVGKYPQVGSTENYHCNVYLDMHHGFMIGIIGKRMKRQIMSFLNRQDIFIPSIIMAETIAAVIGVSLFAAMTSLNVVDACRVDSWLNCFSHNFF